MRLFLDSANLEDIREALDIGIISGITTNPSLMAKEPKSDFYKYLRDVWKLVCAYPVLQPTFPISVEVFEKVGHPMEDQARIIHEDFPGAVVKIPVGWPELEVIKRLSNRGVPVNCTAIFTTAQAIMALDAGARYISFFYNRMKDSYTNLPVPYTDEAAGHLSQRTINDMRKLLIRSPRATNCEIICGSIRKADDVVDCFLAGADIVTCSLPILKQMCVHPGTTASVEKFMADFKEWQS